MKKIKRALISVWDKNNLDEFAKFLISKDIQIISTGGTMDYLKRIGCDVKSISSLTKNKQIMNGRVKTLHPKIFGGILADRNNNSHLDDLISIDASLIDMVIVNLYPFEEEVINKNISLKKAIEYIDIGGPSMLRAAAKNFEHVIPIARIEDYDNFINLYEKNKGDFSLEERKEFAAKIFQVTNKYDFLIHTYLNNKSKQDSMQIDFTLDKIDTLRYGENPHQEANYYLPKNEKILWSQLNGKKLSYNNYFDIETAISIVYEFKEKSCSIIKHANPCGFAIGKSLKSAYLNAVQTDSTSYFGGIVGFNYEVDKEVAIEINKSFLECIVAPSFSYEAIEELKKKKNLRLITISKKDVIGNTKKIIKSSFNGFLIQDKDVSFNDDFEYKIVSHKKPNEVELKALHLSWKLVKYVKSNAIVFSNDTHLLGVGAGQMSRVDSVKLAIRKSKENKLNLDGAVMASDAFFPFSDCVTLAKEAGLVGVIQPGGSINDKKVIDEINRLDMYMVITNKRHFYH